MPETGTTTQELLSTGARRRLELLARRYPTREALMLPALWMVQEEHGWISPEAMQYVAQLLGVSPVRVYGVVSFYHMFHEQPPGKFNIQVCQTLSCSLRGAESLLAGLRAKLGIDAGETSADGRFMIQRVECLGACEHAPVCQINENFAFDLTPEKLAATLDELP